MKLGVRPNKNAAKSANQNPILNVFKWSNSGLGTSVLLGFTFSVWQNKVMTQKIVHFRSGTKLNETTCNVLENVLHRNHRKAIQKINLYLIALSKHFVSQCSYATSSCDMMVIYRKLNETLSLLFVMTLWPLCFKADHLKKKLHCRTLYKKYS